MKDKKVPATEEILEMIRGRDFAHAEKMYELGRELGCEIDPQKQKDGYKIRYRLKHHDRDLYTVECGEDHFCVKTRLNHMDHYKDTLSNCSDRVIECIKKSGEDMKTEFALDGKKLNKKEQVFENMRTPDWADLVELIRREHRFSEK